MIHTTCGWKLLVRWKDKSGSWMPLKDMKELYHAETVYFDEVCGIDVEPDFVWWVPFTLSQKYYHWKSESTIHLT